MSAAITDNPLGSHANASRFGEHKLETIESFMAFARGESLPKWPAEIFLEVSNVCNLKCAMCHTFSALNPWRFLSLRETERGFMDAAHVQQPLEALLSHALNVHCFGYGEPTIHPEFKEFIAEIAKYEVLIDFFTNGMNLTPELCRFLVENRVYSITVSFSGVTKEEYENVYIGGVFEQVLLGMYRLAQEKERRGSIYPMIEINSLSYEHHIAQLPRFVEMMADHGANLIHLKALHAHSYIPPLAGHASVFRPSVEGLIISQAEEAAARRGVELSCTQYLQTAVGNDKAWAEAKAQQGAKDYSGGPLVPIARFKSAAKDVQVIRPPAEKAEEAITPDYSSEENVQAVLNIRSQRDDSKVPFYCFEPYKTVYVRQSGKIKTCCFASDSAPAMGDLNAQSGEQIWNGPRYKAVRESILGERYPMLACRNCLRDGFGPREHFMHAKFTGYRQWFETNFGTALGPDYRNELIQLGDNSDIAERYLQRHPDLAPGGRRNTEVIQVDSVAELSPAVFELLQSLKQCAAAKGDRSELFAGHLDKIEECKLFGWCWSPSNPQLRLPVTIYDGERAIGRVIANRFRHDLLRSGIHDGKYGFEFRIPDNMRDGASHRVTARLADSGALLRPDALEFKSNS